jgi:DNA invertase Pin-like site-specific DNA recombinase
MKGLGKRVGIYVRVSTPDQSCELQRRELEEFVRFRGWSIHNIYEDTATGTNGDRPEFKRLMEEAHEGTFEILLCWKLDRVFRSLKGLVDTLQDLTEFGVEFVSFKDQIDLTTSSGRLMTHILAAFAEFEASLIRERVKAGIENARRKGKRLGRPKTCDHEAIRKHRKQGCSYRKIAKDLNVSVASVQRALAAS